MSKPTALNNRLQLFWGAALVVVGIAVIVKAVYVMPQLNQLNQASGGWGVVRIIGICIIGIILIGGGLRKLWRFFQGKSV